MRRRDILGLLGTVVLAPSLAYSQPASVPRVGLLDPGIPHLFDAFIKGMAGLGYTEGKTVAYVRRSTEGRAAGLATLAAELVRLKVNVIVTAGTAPIRAAMQATPTIPIVFAATGDAVGSGVVPSLAHPGGNATGLSFLNTELSAKRLEILYEAFPNTRRIAVLRDRNTFNPDLEATEDGARRLGLKTLAIEVATPEELNGAFKAAVAGRAEIIDVLASPFFNAQRVRLVELAAQYRLPAIYESGEYVKAGGLLSYGPDLADLFRRAAGYADKVLKGANPGDLPVEQATKFELLINLKAANALGLAIPQSLLLRADEMIE